MSSIKQNIRTVLADVQTFLVETLKGVKLNSSAKDHKDRLLEKVKQLLDEIPGSAGSLQLDGSNTSDSLKISGGGESGSGDNSSSNLQALGEDGYSDDITKIAASDLKNKLQAGQLDRKKKSGLKSWEGCYCIVSNNIFYIYKKQSDSKQKEAFCLNGYEFREAPGLEKDAAKKEMCFEVVKTDAPTYQFRAGSKEGMIHWREAITKGIQMVPRPAEEDGEIYDDLVDIVGDHHYSNFDNYEIPSGEPPSFATPPPPPSNPPPKGDESYENLSSPEKPSTAGGFAKGANDSRPPSGVKSFGQPPPNTSEVRNNAVNKATKGPNLRPRSVASQRQGPPPMVDIFEGQAPAKASDGVGGKKADDGNTKRTSLPASFKRGGLQSEADCTPGPVTSPAKKVPVQGNNSRQRAAPTQSRELPPPPSAAPDSQPKSPDRGSSSMGNSAPEDEPTPVLGVKNLKMLFQ